MYNSNIKNQTSTITKRISEIIKKNLTDNLILKTSATPTSNRYEKAQTDHNIFKIIQHVFFRPLHKSPTQIRCPKVSCVYQLVLRVAFVFYEGFYCRPHLRRLCRWRMKFKVIAVSCFIRDHNVDGRK